MSDTQPIDDGFDAYYTEKIWNMIPETYRQEDGLMEPPGALRALVLTWAKQASNLRRSQDRLWEDLFIALCSDWAIPYIGDLVGTRMISAYNPRGQRIDVAKTIYYRLRSGTLRVLEELIADITGWEGVVVEGFKTLARTHHNLDAAPVYDGRLTSTPRAGTAELRRANGTGVVGGPFDEYFYTPDVRRTRPYGIPKLIFNLYRLGAVELHEVPPAPHAAPTGTAFTIDPSGRDVPLFARRSRPERFDNWRSALEYELPARIECRLLADAQYMIAVEHADMLVAEVGLTAAAADDLRTINGIRFMRESEVRTWLSMLPSQAELLSAGVYPSLLRLAQLDDCGKAALYPASINLVVDGAPLPPEQVAAGNLSAWEAFPLHKRAVIDPERGRLIVYDPVPESVTIDYHVGVYQPVGAVGFTRSFTGAADQAFSGGGAISGIPGAGLARIDDSRTYAPVDDVAAITTLTIAAADEERPYLPLTSDWTLTGAPPVGDSPDAVLNLEGLWIGAGGAAHAVILDGDYDRVVLRYCTLDPGGVDADGNSIPSVTLVIRGYVEALVIDRCVIGVVRLEGTGAVETLTIRDSIIQSTIAGEAALQIGVGVVDLARTTVLGGIDILRLYATDVIVSGVVDVTDTQTGCFRFSAAAPGSRLPRPFETVTLEANTNKALFLSDEYGQPDYAVLTEQAPTKVARGAENGAEMGVFNRAGAPFKRDSLNTKIAEFMPFGLLPIVVIQS